MIFAIARYHSVKKDQLKRFSGKFIDKKVGEPAIAACVPLTVDQYSHESPASQAALVDENGLAGVACTGILFKHLSTYLKDVWPPEDYESEMAYITDQTGAWKEE